MTVNIRFVILYDSSNRILSPLKWIMKIYTVVMDVVNDATKSYDTHF